MAYCREQEKIHNKNFRFTMTTNGVLIDDDVIDFCNKECHNVVLSLDGRKEVNDRFRVDCAGNGSYDRIVPKFQECAITIKVAENQELAAKRVLRCPLSWALPATPALTAKPANEHDHPHRGFCAQLCTVRHRPAAYARPQGAEPF